jgi:hypothetical protein
MGWGEGVGGGPVGARPSGGGGGVRLSVQQRQPVGNDPSMPATGRWAWLLKTEEVGHCHVGPMAQCQSAESNGVQLI